MNVFELEAGIMCRNFCSCNITNDHTIASSIMIGQFSTRFTPEDAHFGAFSEEGDLSKTIRVRCRDVASFSSSRFRGGWGL